MVTFFHYNLHYVVTDAFNASLYRNGFESTVSRMTYILVKQKTKGVVFYKN